MSVWELGRVWRDAEYDGKVLMVLMAVAASANNRGLCYVHVPSLAKEARASERTVQSALRRLCRVGELTLVTQPVDGKSSWTYQLGVKWLHPSYVAERVADFTPGVKSQARNKEREVLRSIENPPTPLLKRGVDETPAHPKPPQAAPEMCGTCGNSGMHETAAHPGRKLYCDCAFGKSLREADAGPPISSAGSVVPRRRRG